MLKNIIFDLGGVLIDWNPEYLYQKIIHDSEKRAWFLANICTSDWNECQDEGRLLEDGTAILVNQYPDYSDEIKAFYGRWQEMLGGPIEGTVKILNDLNNHFDYPLYALTNWSAETFPVALERYGFLQLFKDIVVSGKEKMKKPAPEIYNLILAKHDLEPSQTLFIDDNERNIEAANELGILTIHFTSPDQLQKELKANYQINVG